MQEIWDSIAADLEHVPITEAQRAELERRWEALQRDPEAGESWDEVKRAIAAEE